MSVLPLNAPQQARQQTQTDLVCKVSLLRLQKHLKEISRIRNTWCGGFVQCPTMVPTQRHVKISAEENYKTCYTRNY